MSSKVQKILIDNLCIRVKVYFLIPFLIHIIGEIENYEKEMKGP